MCCVCISQSASQGECNYALRARVVLPAVHSLTPRQVSINDQINFQFAFKCNIITHLQPSSSSRAACQPNNCNSDSLVTSWGPELRNHRLHTSSQLPNMLKAESVKIVCSITVMQKSKIERIFNMKVLKMATHWSKNLREDYYLLFKLFPLLVFGINMYMSTVGKTCENKLVGKRLQLFPIHRRKLETISQAFYLFSLLSSRDASGWQQSTGVKLCIPPVKHVLRASIPCKALENNASFFQAHD